jgi:hypothetical protein
MQMANSSVLLKGQKKAKQSLENYMSSRLFSEAFTTLIFFSSYQNMHITGIVRNIFI